jgi:hypothetical protein
VSRVSGNAWVYTSILEDGETEFNTPVYSNYGNSYDITRKTIVPATGLYSASPFADYPTIYSVYLEAERVASNASITSNFNISTVSSGADNIKYEVISLAPNLVLGNY